MKNRLNKIKNLIFQKYEWIIAFGWVSFWIIISKFIWFKGVEFIASGDFAPILNNHTNTWYSILDLQNGSIITYQNILRAFPYYLFHSILDLIRLSPQNQEVLWLGLNFALPAISMYMFLKKLFPESRRLYLFVSAFIYNINFLIVNNILIVRPLWTLYFILPLTLLFIERSIEEIFRDKNLKLSRGNFLLALLSFSIMLSILINPPTLFLGIGTIFLFLTFRFKAYYTKKFPIFFKRYMRSLIPVAISLLILNLWIIFPFAVGLFGSSTRSGSEVVDLEFVEWTAENSSIDNVLIGKGNYFFDRTSINESAYFPYASKYSTPWMITLMGLMTLIYLAGLKVKSNITTFALVLFVTTVFLAKGAHTPLGFLNKFAFENLPLFWLFRSPFLKAATIMYLTIAILNIQSLNHVFNFKNKFLMPLLSLGLVIISSIIAFPIFTGEIFPGDRGDLPGARVDIPDYWFETSGYINSNKEIEKVMLYPQNPFYQTHYDWQPDGYHAVDIAGRLIEKPIVSKNPGGGYESNSDYELLVDFAYRDPNQVHFLKLLGITHILYRKDLDVLHYGKSNDQTQLIKFPIEYENQELIVYKVPGSNPSLSSIFYSNDSDYSIYDTLSLVNENPVLASDPRLTDNRIINLTSVETIENADPSVRELVLTEDEMKGGSLNFFNNYLFYTLQTKQPNKVRLIRPELNININDKKVVVPSDTIDLNYIDPAVLININGSFTKLSYLSSDWQSVGQLNLKVIDKLLTYSRIGSTARDLATFDVQNCFNPKNLTLEEAGISYIQNPDGTFDLNADSYKACLRFPVSDLRDTDLIEYEIVVKNNKGNPLEMCLWDAEERLCVVREFAENKDFEKYTFRYLVKSIDQNLSLYLYSSASNDGETSNSIKQVHISKYTKSDKGTGNLNAELEKIVGETPAIRQIIELKDDIKSINRISVSLPDVKTQKLINFENTNLRGNLSDCFKSQNLTLKEAGIKGELVNIENNNLALSLKADRNSACYQMLLGKLDPTQDYFIQFMAQNIRGNGPRVCIKSVIDTQCEDINFEIIEEVKGGFSTFIGKIYPRNDRQYFLYLYSAASDEKPTENIYDDIKLISAPQGISNSILFIRKEEDSTNPYKLNKSLNLPFMTFMKYEGEENKKIVISDFNSYDRSWITIKINNKSFFPTINLLTHFKANNFSNGWVLENADNQTYIFTFNFLQIIEFMLILIALLYLASISGIKIRRNK